MVKKYTLEEITGDWADPYLLLSIRPGRITLASKGPAGKLDRPLAKFYSAPIMEFDATGKNCRLTKEITLHVYEKNEVRETLMVSIEGFCFPKLLEKRKGTG